MGASLPQDSRFALVLDPRLGGLGSSSLAAAKAKVGSAATKRGQAQDFEAVFLNSMFQHMFTAIDGEGPFGKTTGTGPWRSFLTEQYAKSFVKAGGIGLADQVYNALIAQQAARTK